MKERTRTWRLPPCPPYDVEGTESWLYDMALQGWMLEKDGLFFGVASFEKKNPASIRVIVNKKVPKMSEKIPHLFFALSVGFPPTDK